MTKKQQPKKDNQKESNNIIKLNYNSIHDTYWRKLK